MNKTEIFTLIECKTCYENKMMIPILKDFTIKLKNQMCYQLTWLVGNEAKF